MNTDKKEKAIRKMDEMTAEERREYLGTFVEQEGSEYLRSTEETDKWLKEHNFI